MKSVITLCFVATSGCSVLVMRKPVERMPAPPDCISSRMLPAYDFVMAGASLLLAATVKGAPEDNGMGGVMQTAFAIESIPYLLSGMYGLSRAAECTKVKARWETEVLPRVID